MSRFDDLVGGVMRYSRIVIVVMLLATAAVGYGAPMVEESSSLDQFQSDSKASEKLDYIDENFSTRDDNTTTAQIIVQGEDVLSKESLLAILRYEQRMRANETINGTLTDDRPVVSVANLVATTAIVQEEGRELQALAAEFERERAAFEANRTAVQERSTELNATAEDLRRALTVLRENPNASVRAQWETVTANTSVDLDERDYRTFQKAASDLRNASSKQEAEAAYRLGTKGVLQDEFEALQARSKQVKAEGKEVQELGERVQDQQGDFENATDPSLERQMKQLRSMNDSEVDDTVTTVLNASANPRALALMPTGYEPGSTDADATMIIVRQRTEGGPTAQGSARDEIVDSQLAMQDLDRPGGKTFAVFGSGVIAHEIDASMADSMAIVGPIALLFVLLALGIAYRDVLDILLGLVGIAAVLLWTFGFMGWAGIAFNQLFVAVPVLLIGLSIDYAIHIFMRHREERTTLVEDGDVADDGPRNSMAVALGGVGIALVWVTATTVIGFLSNLTSPVPPIREFGVVSAAGIVAALLVFGTLVPALKVELDELFEGFGLNRRKRAFGTGGGTFSSVLAVGATAAKKAPLALVLIALLLSAGGAYGGSQVDTSFSQSDFLAEDPPAWMDRLPEGMQPGDYSAKSNLDLVNDNFVREDSQAQVLFEGDVTSDRALERVATAEDRAASKPVTQNLSNGEAAITSPLSVMHDVADRNESFNETLAAADTDGDGVPDRNLETVYDELYRVAPEQAASVVHREDGEYRALRMVVSVEGGASGDAVTTQMRDVADAGTGDGIDATATGGSILNEIVQDELLRTVVVSLIVTLVAVVLFLMAAYRITEGSASLGLVTMLPVVLSVAWILGTMYALGIPFNVLTGMITSLTVGLGVAYSIHLSERYNQELERTESVWDAMDRAVTGTGGALLGSAATTVGGFGVLVFAILPPLQQFGFITGVTIVYAFLASVVVLPSLLVVWTRYAGPESARAELAAHGISALTRDGDASDGATEAPADGAATDPTTNGASTDGVARPSVRRSLSVEVVEPGDIVEVTVALSGLSGRVLLSESFDGEVQGVVDVDPDPVETVVRNGSVYAAWETDGDASLTYRAAVPGWATDEDEPLFSGRLLTGDGDVAVAGAQQVTVVTDLFERIIARDEVTEDDLAAAGDRLVAGDLDAQQFERIYRSWLGDAEGLPERQAPPQDDD